MRHDLDFHTHVIFSKPCNPDAGPDWFVIRHPLLEVPHHCHQRFVVERDVVRVDAENLGPAFSARIFEVVVNILEGLVDLGIDFEQVLAGLTIPSTYAKLSIVLRNIM